MPRYEVEVDVTLVCRKKVEADSKQEAIEKVEDLAYEDTWCTGMSWGGAKVYMIEEVGGDNDE